MSQRKRPRDLRAGLADIYAAKTPAKKETTAAEDTGTPAETPPDAGSDERQIGRVGGAPAVLVEQQRQGLMRENAELRAALDRMRTDGQVTAELDVDHVLDRFPADRLPQAFADAAFETLVESIRDNGQDQPILVRPHPEETDRFQIAYGRRRREACRRLGRPVRALVRPLDDDELLRLMIRENEEREDLSLYERARFMRFLGETEKLSVRQLGKRMGLSAGYVSRLLRLPELPAPLLSLIGDPRSLSMRTLEALAQILERDAERQIDRILEGWGRIKPSSSPDGRARQIVKLALGQLPSEPGESRPIRGPGGRVIGQMRRDKDGKRRIDLSPDLADREVDSILEAVENALAEASPAEGV
ncbi:MAG: ParB/RepB/Spo0J family partition protein [Geminicoccaceae bacterium]|nr:ParB/RepB/Spo0J family partition protein [Geminicoccaceae bacterium]